MFKACSPNVASNVVVGVDQAIVTQAQMDQWRRLVAEVAQIIDLVSAQFQHLIQASRRQLISTRDFSIGNPHFFNDI